MVHKNMDVVERSEEKVVNYSKIYGEEYLKLSEKGKKRKIQISGRTQGQNA